MLNTAIFVNKIEMKKNDGEISHTTSQHATLDRHDRSIPRDVPRDKGLYPVNIFIPWDNFWFIPLQPYDQKEEGSVYELKSEKEGEKFRSLPTFTETLQLNVTVFIFSRDEDARNKTYCCIASCSCSSICRRSNNIAQLDAGHALLPVANCFFILSRVYHQSNVELWYFSNCALKKKK